MDRGKFGSKVHLLTERTGLPLAIGTSGANRHVERSMSWLAGCRRQHRRYERKAEHFLAFTSIACTLMSYGDSPHEAEHQFQSRCKPAPHSAESFMASARPSALNTLRRNSVMPQSKRVQVSSPWLNTTTGQSSGSPWVSQQYESALLLAPQVTSSQASCTASQPTVIPAPADGGNRPTRAGRPPWSVMSLLHHSRLSR
ncbi:hypothetical protein B5181_18265 [Streptomyces sp. 4F]|nr:hypothetical protein B5181_18265 [Streptomyces sp. 4F]